MNTSAFKVSQYIRCSILMYSNCNNCLSCVTADVLKMVKVAKFYKSLDYVCLYYTIHEAVVIGQEIVDAEIKVRIFVLRFCVNVVTDKG